MPMASPLFVSRQKLLLHVTRTYKHLGTVASADLSMQPEISSKIASMRNAVKAVKGDFLSRPSIPLEPRLLVLNTLVFSKGLFQAGTWPLLYVSELSRLHKQIMSIYASIVDAGIHVASRRSHDLLLQVDGVIAPFILLTCLRIRLFIRIVLQAPEPVLVVLFEAQGGQRAWIDAVEHDLRFISLNSLAFSFMARAPVRKWVETIRLNPRSIYASLNDAVAEKRLNAPSAWARSKRLRDMHSVFRCEHRDCTAGSRQAAIHAFKSHGRQRLARSFIDCPYCPVCLQMFYSREKVICHLEKKISSMSNGCPANIHALASNYY